MIGDGEGQARFGDLRVAGLQSSEGMKGTFMDVVTVDPKQGCTVFAAHDLMHRPQFVEQRLRLLHAVETPCSRRGLRSSGLSAEDSRIVEDNADVSLTMNRRGDTKCR